MHEFALADAVVATALDAAERSGLAVISRIHVRIGELQQIDRENFEFCLREIMPSGEPRLAKTEISIEVEHARFGCRSCGHEFALDDTTKPREKDEAEAIHFIPELAHAYLACPRCDSPDFKFLRGRGVTLESIEGD